MSDPSRLQLSTGDPVITFVVTRHGSDPADASTDDWRVSTVALRDCQTALESCQGEGGVSMFLLGILVMVIVDGVIGWVMWRQRKAGGE